MSVVINLSSLSTAQVDSINTDLVVPIERNKYNAFAKIENIFAFSLNHDNTVSIPFAYAVQELNLSRRNRASFPQRNVIFTGTLRDQQIDVFDEGKDKLSRNGFVMLSLPTGFGKTFLSIKLSTITKLKTLIIVNKVVLMNQWEESIKKVCPTATIHVLKKAEPMKDCDFFIINAINVAKKGMGYFKDIGTVIVDECHLIMAECLSKSLQFLAPRYLIGLSATPYRTDGMDPLIGFYFGDDKIIKLFRRKHTVYKVNTGFVPDYTLTKDGKVNWGSLLDSQCNNRERNELILQIVRRNKDRNILILSKRIEQGNYLYDRLKEENENVTSLIGKQQEFDVNARVLVGTTSKCGTGFDFPKLDCLILASDIQQYYVQALGRVLRRPDVEPMVFDLVDENQILRMHYESRAQVYREIGGNIVVYNSRSC
jgi:superfamily II DNA or RNA helicase